MSLPVAQQISEQYTSLVLTGGRDCKPDRIRTWQNPDLWVHGGAIIDKTLCVGGNIGTDQYFIGNICADKLLVSIIEEKYIQNGIDVFGDVRFHGNIIGGNIQGGGGGTAGVSSFSAGTTGLTPNTPTTGPVVLGGSLNAQHGGTGQTTYVVGDILYANSTTTLGRLPDVAVGNALLSGGVGMPPFYGKISLSNAISGVLPIANGGTNSGTALTNGKIMISQGGQIIEGTSSTDPSFNTITVTDNAAVQGNLTVQGKLTASTLCVTDDSMLQGNVTVSDDLVVLGDEYISGNLHVAQKIFADRLCVLGDSEFFGNVSFSGGMVAGVSSFSAGTTGFSPLAPTMGAVVLSGTLNFGHGGTGLTATPSAGQIPIGTGTGFSLSTLTPGSGISVNNGAGTITLINSGVTSVTPGSGISASSSTGAITLTNTGVTSITPGSGISVSSSTGSITLVNTGVTSFSAGTTGFSPTSPSTGAVVLSGTLNASNGGTGISATPANGQTLIGNGTTFVLANITPGSGISVANGAGTITISATNAGTVTNIATGTGLSGGPITTTGTISIATTGVSAGTYGSSSAVPSFAVNAQGQLTSAGSSQLSLTTGVTGALPPSNGGTGITATPTNGQILIGNGSGFTLNTLTSGTGMSVTNMSGAITLTNIGVTSVTGGTGISVSSSIGAVTISAIASGVTSFSAGTTGFSPTSATTGAVTLSGTLNAANGGTGISSFTAGDVLYATSSTTLSSLPIGAAGQILTVSGSSLPVWAAPAMGGGGTVTSVGLSAPSIFTVSGSPVTTTGTLTFTSNTQTANTIYSGPVSGGAAVPTFRALVVADLPTNIPNANLQNASITVTGGTGLSVSGSPVSLGGSLTLSNTGVTSATAGTGISLSASTGAITINNTGVTSVIAGSGISVSGSTGAVTITSLAGGGTVTSVGLSAPSIFTVSGSPVTTTGTLTFTSNTQTANTIYSGPVSGGAAIPTFRSLVVADLPTSIPNANLQNASITVTGGTGISVTGSPVSLGGSLTVTNVGVTSFSAGTTGFSPTSATTGAVVLSGTLNASNGGTGISATPANGQLLIGNGTGFSLMTLSTSGTGISVANGAGTITLSNTGVTDITAGTAISVSASTGSITVTNTGVTGISAGTGISISASTGTVTISATGTAGVTSFSAGTTGFSPTSASTGAVVLSGTLNASNGGTGISATPTNGQLLIGNGTGFTLNTLSAGTGISIVNGSGSISLSATNDAVLDSAASPTYPTDLTKGVWYGLNTKANAFDSSTITLGSNASTGATNAIAIGNGAVASLANSIAIGGTGITANQVGGFFVQHRGPLSVTFNAAGFIPGTDELVELTSSRRYKTNIRDLEEVSNKFEKLRPVRFNPIEGYGEVNSEHIGFIAEEVEELFPEFATHDANGQTTGMMYDRFVSVLVREMQAMKREYTAKIKELENKLSANH